MSADVPTEAHLQLQTSVCSTSAVARGHPGGSDPAELLARALPGEAGWEDAVF